MKKLLPIIFLIPIIMLSGCGNKPESQQTPVKADEQKITIVKKSVIDDYYETSGTVKAKTSADIAGKILARVDAVNIEEGDSVQKGQLLVVMDNNDIQAKVRSAEAAYSEAEKNQKIAYESKILAETTYERYKNIYEEKALTGQELDEASAKRNIARFECKRAIETMNRAKAALDEAKTLLSYSKIYAPISGIVTAKNIDTGDTAAPGQVLLTIKDTSLLEIVSEIDESYIKQVTKGTPVKINNDFDAVVSEAIASVDPVTRAFKIKINLTDTDLKDGQYVTVAVPVGKRETIVISASAVVTKGQLEGVYDAGGKFKLIKTGKAQGNMVEVLSGLEEGDTILSPVIARSERSGATWQSGKRGIKGANYGN